MKDIIAVINQKGGVGKSTTANAIGAGLMIKGFKVLYIDLDAQGNLSYTTGIDSISLTENTVFDLLTGQIKAEKAIHRVNGSDIIPSSPALAGADIVLNSVGKEYRLKEALENISDDYDYVIIDTPPALGVLTVNALTACTGIIIPAQADIYSMQGIGQLYNTINTVKKYCNPKLEIMGILLTRFNSRTVISRDVAETVGETAGQLQTKLYNVKIRECTAVKEAQAVKQDIFAYAPKSNAASDYMDFLDELCFGK